MNNFEKFIQSFVEAAKSEDLIFSIDVIKPVKKTGVWSVALSLDDDFTLEVEWSTSRGFGLVAGRNLAFGSGIHEIFATVNPTVDRSVEILKSKIVTDSTSAMTLAELRKSFRIQQSDLAERMGMSASGLAQMENEDLIEKMRIGTLAKIILAMGGTLKLVAAFPGQDERQITM